MRALVIASVLSGSACTAFVTATHPDLQKTTNICARASDPRCTAMAVDLSTFAGGIALQAAALHNPTHYYSTAEDAIGLGLVVGVFVLDVVASFIWPERM